MGCLINVSVCHYESCWLLAEKSAPKAPTAPRSGGGEGVGVGRENSPRRATREERGGGGGGGGDSCYPVEGLGPDHHVEDDTATAFRASSRCHPVTLYRDFLSPGHHPVYSLLLISLSHACSLLVCRFSDTAVARVSDDFYPRDPASSSPHIAACSYNSLLMGVLIQPDWDMFHRYFVQHVCKSNCTAQHVYCM